MYAQFGEELILSPKGAEIIGNAEGCRRDPYKCPADVLTVGIGSTAYSGQPVDPKHRYTDLEIAERWKNDIQVAEKCVPYRLPLMQVVSLFATQPYSNSYVRATITKPVMNILNGYMQAVRYYLA